MIFIVKQSKNKAKTKNELCFKVSVGLNYCCADKKEDGIAFWRCHPPFTAFYSQLLLVDVTENARLRDEGIIRYKG